MVKLLQQKYLLHQLHVREDEALVVIVSLALLLSKFDARCDVHHVTRHHFDGDLFTLIHPAVHLLRHTVPQFMLHVDVSYVRTVKLVHVVRKGRYMT